MKGDIYHIINRGVEKRKIFLNEDNYLRFVNNLKDFNSKNVVSMSYSNRRKFNNNNSALREPNNELVDILCVCLMPNHFHLLVREKIDGGAGIFSQKVSSGYTQSFNLKNDRSGVLFQGRTKIIPVDEDAHFLHLPYYIFSNPVKLIEPKWKEKGIQKRKEVVKFLENYKWSSFSETVSGNRGIFGDIINNDLFNSFFEENSQQFKKDFTTWLCESRIE